MRDYRFMAQLPTSYLQSLLTMREYSAQEKSTARLVLKERHAPFKTLSRRQSGKRQRARQT